ncbi:MAG: TIGR04283 family arsenosugar biosynthesis glycosyltransferase [Vicinamibacteria bacterium]
MKLSVVLPTWNEAEALASALKSLPTSSEVIVADGGSADDTMEVARSWGARLVSCERGRARQMNLGARLAEGEVLLFLHADSALGPGADSAIESALADSRTVGGSFRLRIRSTKPALKLVALGSNSRARYLGMPYGDQGIFLRRSVYDEIGGFPDIPFLEDVALIRLLRRKGRLVQLDVPLSTGDRHWRDLGVAVTTLLNWTMVALYLGGVSPERLAPHYRRLRGPEGMLPKTPRKIAPAAQPD